MAKKKKFKLSKNIKIVLIAIAVILVVLVVWGLIGSSQVADIGKTCDIGLGKDGSTFCWKWHTNAVGKVANLFK